MKNTLKLLILIAVTSLLAAPLPAEESGAPAPVVSGRLVNGLRILPVPAGGQDLRFKVYRGDYIKFGIDAASKPLLLTVPQLDIQQEVSADLAKSPYFKMKQTGAFAFTLGKIRGRITVINYNQSHYTELSAAEAEKLIADRAPLILDVRTPGEYKRGHLENAALIPVQILGTNLDKLADYKDREILIYCATGNRSTVASKILIDNGFNRIFNLRRGIVDWHKHRYPVVK